MSGLIAAVIGSNAFLTVVTWLLQRVDSRRDPLRDGVRELLFCKLEALHLRMVDNDGVMSVPDKETAERIYDSYHALGGNGVGTRMIAEIRQAHIK
nr:MAG TPA: minor structural protein [Caudoviricetes sp.]